MYERRLKLLIAALLICLGGIVVRLAQLQVVEGHYYQDLAERGMVKEPLYLPFLRGEIQDRNGMVLARDEASFDVGVYYKLLSEDQQWIHYVARRWVRRNGAGLTKDKFESRVQQRIRELDDLRTQLYDLLAQLTDRDLGEVYRQRDQIVAWVTRMKHAVQRARQDEISEIREERMRHPLVQGLSGEEERQVRMALGRLAWVREEIRGRDVAWVAVDPGRKRVIYHGRTIGHFIGRLRKVVWQSEETRWPSQDELSKYVVGERVGNSGVEKLCEARLRGRKGERVYDLDGERIREEPPVDGANVRLSIDIELQEFVYEVLGKAVRSHPPSPGGAVVILDVPTRQVLALVSYPCYDPQKLTNKQYRALADDGIRQPLLFRAVAGAYPPGSTVKPMVAVMALTCGALTPDDMFYCYGYMFRDQPNRFRCFRRIRHGQIAVEDAIKRSCNVFFYHVGELVGFRPLRDWFQQEFGLGQRPKTGLIEELPGILATQAQYPGESRLLAVGQGKIAITPLQSANMVATIAGGEWMAPSLVLHDTRAKPARVLNASQEALQLVRQAMWKVANEPGGTAEKVIKLKGLRIAGKTGTAEVLPKVIKRRVCWPDPRGGFKWKVVPESRWRQFVEELLKKNPRLRGRVEWPAYERYPPPKRDASKHSHAWFVCYGPYERPKLAMSVFVEFGGTGGRVAAPVANQVLQWIQAHRPQYLFDRHDGPR